MQWLLLIHCSFLYIVASLTQPIIASFWYILTSLSQLVITSFLYIVTSSVQPVIVFSYTLQHLQSNWLLLIHCSISNPTNDCFFIHCSISNLTSDGFLYIVASQNQYSLEAFLNLKSNKEKEYLNAYGILWFRTTFYLSYPVIPKFCICILSVN